MRKKSNGQNYRRKIMKICEDDVKSDELIDGNLYVLIQQNSHFNGNNVGDLYIKSFDRMVSIKYGTYRSSFHTEKYKDVTDEYCLKRIK